MALSTRVWGAGKRLLIGGALILTSFLFAAAAMRLALKTRDAVVPALNGKSVNEAGTILTAAGLNLKVEEARRVDPTVPAGRIISQDPQPGVNTRRERSVKAWVSRGPRAASVRALVGGAERTAQRRVAGGVVGADGAATRPAGRPATRLARRDPLGRVHGRHDRRAESAAQADDA